MRNKEFWLFLFITFIFLFNWPFLDIFSLSLPYYFFAVWGTLVGLIFLFSRRREREGRKSGV
jgi:predicted membrane metal-binding protein